MLRSHWTNGDFVWIANAKINKNKLLACFCHFSKGIDQRFVNLYPEKNSDFSIIIEIPEPLIMMSDPRIIQYLSLDLINDNFIT